MAPGFRAPDAIIDEKILPIPAPTPPRPIDLIFVSPRTGRAVSREAGAPYEDKLLLLPGFLAPVAGTAVSASDSDIHDGLRLTGYFLTRHVFDPLNRPPPAARDRLTDLLESGGESK